MDIALSPETQRLLEDKLAGGGYSSADEVVRAAFGALDELQARELDQETLDAIDRAEAQVERGEVHDWKDVRERVRRQFLNPPEP